MSQNLENFVKFQKFQLENLVDFEKCCKTHILLQKSEPIQPKTSNILPKFCQPTLSDDWRTPRPLTFPRCSLATSSTCQLALTRVSVLKTRLLLHIFTWQFLYKIRNSQDNDENSDSDCEDYLVAEQCSWCRARQALFPSTQRIRVAAEN